MPLPLIPVAIGLAIAGSGGVAFGGHGVSRMVGARKKVAENQERFDAELARFLEEESRIGADAAEYGKLQLEVQATTLGAWLQWLEANERKVRRLDREYVDGVRVEVPDIPALRLRVANAADLLAGGVSAAMAAVATQQAALFGVRSLAVAGTGAAISGLSGAAAESATLAWLGGGTLAAGGGGVAAGTAMLTGFAIAPALLIGGITLSIQGQKAWTQALEHEADVDTACEQMHARAELFDQLRTRMDELRSVLGAVDTRAMASLARLQQLDFDPDQHAAQFQETALLMRAVGEILSTPLLDGEGQLTPESLIVLRRYQS